MIGSSECKNRSTRDMVVATTMSFDSTLKDRAQKLSELLKKEKCFRNHALVQGQQVDCAGRLIFKTDFDMLVSRVVSNVMTQCLTCQVNINCIARRHPIKN